MSDSIFVDTNVLVYSRDISEPQKQPLAAAWMAHLWENRTGRLSFQVLQEFHVTVVFKLDPGLEAEKARKDLGDRTVAGLNQRPAGHTADPTPRVLEGARMLSSR